MLVGKIRLNKQTMKQTTTASKITQTFRYIMNNKKNVSLGRMALTEHHKNAHEGVETY